MEALVTADVHRAEVAIVPTPTLGSDEILVRVLSVTLNPTDWKHVAYISKPGAIVGSDFCGIVEDVASDIKGDVKKGDRVAGVVRGAIFPDRGSFAQYLKVESRMVFKVPERTDSAAASSAGVAGLTAAQALFLRLGIPLPDTTRTSLPDLAHDADELLVWAGSSTVGQYAIQLARAAGYRVIATASPKNHDLLKSMGAAHLYDYNDPETPDKIANAHPNLSRALDCFSEKGTQSLAARSLGTKGGKVIVLLAPEEDAVNLRNDVTIDVVLLYTIFGKAFKAWGIDFNQARCDKDHDEIIPWLDGDKGLLHALFKNGLIKGNRIKHMDGGLHSVNEGLKYLQDGKASAEKIAFTIDV